MIEEHVIFVALSSKALFSSVSKVIIARCYTGFASKHILTTDIAHKSHVTFLTNQKKVRTSCDFSRALLRC